MDSKEEVSLNLQDAMKSTVDVNFTGISTSTTVSNVVSPSPTELISIAGVELSCIIDTGAEASLIPSQIYHSKLEPVLGPLGSMEFAIKIKGVGNAPVPIEGYLETEVSMQGWTATVGFLVLPDDLALDGRKKNHPILLGCNALKKLASVPVEGREFRILLGDTLVPLEVEPPEVSCAEVSLSTGPGQELILPHTSKQLKCTATKPTEKGSVLLIVGLVEDWDVIEGSCEGGNDNFIIMVANHGD